MVSKIEKLFVKLWECFDIPAGTICMCLHMPNLEIGDSKDKLLLKRRTNLIILEKALKVRLKPSTSHLCPRGDRIPVNELLHSKFSSSILVFP